MTAEAADPAGAVELELPDPVELELTVGPVGHGGFCVARHAGRVVFVRHALPGERVRAVVTEDRGGSYCRADAVVVLEPAAGRVPPPCPASGPGGCGGCDFQHVDPRMQREFKAQVVAEQLRRIAGLDVEVTVQELPGGPLGWRTRTRLAVDGTGQPGFRVHRSHTVLPVAACPLAVSGSLDAVFSRRWRPGVELEVVTDDPSRAHVAQLPPGRPPKQLSGTGRVVRHAAGRSWELRRGFLAGASRRGGRAGRAGRGLGGRAARWHGVGPLRRCGFVRLGVGRSGRTDRLGDRRGGIAGGRWPTARRRWST